MHAERLGDLEILPLSDGTAFLPPQYFLNADLSAHRDLLNADGVMEIPIGCFLIRTGDRTVLVDAGLGPTTLEWAQGGQLPAQLDAAGYRPEDIDTVVCSHLHVDHAGWLIRRGEPFFPNATLRFGAGDWGHFVETSPADKRWRQCMERLREQDRVQLIETDGELIAPGINARLAPGHTPGHVCLVLSSGRERALLLGDAVTCPVQLEEPDWLAVSDVDPALAARTREALWRELEGTDTRAVAAHFPGLRFGRVLRGEGSSRYFAV